MYMCDRLLGGTTITAFEVRESDVAVLDTMQTSLTAQVTSCRDGATLTETSSGLTVCVLQGESEPQQQESSFPLEVFVYSD